VLLKVDRELPGGVKLFCQLPSQFRAELASCPFMIFAAITMLSAAVE
jgi:hypothetical protein